MNQSTMTTVWPESRTRLGTGDLVNTVMAALCLGAAMPQLVVDPAFAGYCLDAPDHMPAGCVFSGHRGQPEVRGFKR